MKTVCILLLLSLSLQAQEWTSLYNGENLDGWEHVGPGNFIIEDGILKSQGGMGLLWFTGQKFTNVKLRVVYKGADENNAGVFIRIPEKPTEAWMPVHKGYEVQIDDREDEWHKTGVLYSLTKAKASPGIPKEWNTMEITLQGDRTIVHVNGILVTDFKEGDPVPKKTLEYEPDRGPRPDVGYIGIQNHGIKDVIEFKEVSYKNIEDK
ncbi:MAG: DUF1080 domain-containing protein [Bacteroidia bacterium]|nr:DUF1080 domain-containing protein [Bacteroidia bacterium]